MRRCQALLAVFSLLYGATLLAPRVSAQQTLDPGTVDPKACSEQQRLRSADGNAARDPSAQSLSEKLNSTDGVICPPPNVDTEIKAPTPDAGTMPVIPPPGSPGGDPTVRPK